MITEDDWLRIISATPWYWVQSPHNLQQWGGRPTPPHQQAVKDKTKQENWKAQSTVYWFISGFLWDIFDGDGCNSIISNVTFCKQFQDNYHQQSAYHYY